MTAKKITATELKKINRNQIYKIIYKEFEISRMDIALKLGLSLPTVNQNLKELVSSGLIDYSGNFQSTGGRKAQAITPVKDAKVAIGIDIRKSFVRIVAIDLYGNVLDYEKYTKTFSDTDEYSRYLGYLVKNIVYHNRFPEEKILGVGIAVPGVFDNDMQHILAAPSLHVKKMPIEKLTKYIEYPYIIDNDAKAGAFMELWNNSHRGEKIYLSIEKGVGGCIIANDSLYKGAHSRAGEFGHMTIVPNGRPCACGKNGCLEAYISTSRISDDLNCQLEEFFAELSAGNPTYAKHWEEYITYLCIGINNIYMALDMEIILGGMISQYLEPFLEDIRKRAMELNPFGQSGDYIHITKYQSKATVVGVALQLVGKFMDTI